MKENVLIIKFSGSSRYVDETNIRPSTALLNPIEVPSDQMSKCLESNYNESQVPSEFEKVSLPFLVEQTKNMMWLKYKSGPNPKASLQN